ncbi:MAG: ornithine carbamoyltransferase [Candidatus Abyssobacteria bacterium SURF_17]|uniref:Ornithine carbamoyltransferase n=1 Tax=Candidatus Abyssobacteria bacterium SURF_17 TaxID=2093361 RepID=A0A419F8W2_9BACT|nr:MAG: ornithine carbamoyltransferase [Candidatus Abyssubacteria bacterium SURF_17]
MKALRRKDLISIFDLAKEEIEGILSLAATLKDKFRKNISYTPLAGKTLAMIFEKPSLRTRVTFEAGMTQLGGHAIFLGPSDINIGVRETAADVAHNLERWVDGIMARTFSHQTVVDLAREASIPVINGLTDRLHPCQVLSDCFTLQEKLGSLAGRKVAFLGDGNNVAHSWIYASARLGINFSIACPRGYEPLPEIVREASAEATSNICVTHDIAEALSDADAVYTDVWASMGQENEAEKRRTVFAPFQLNSAALALARPQALVMHCLPAHRGEEIIDEVLDGPQSIVFDQAENRLHCQKAILTALMANTKRKGKGERRKAKGQVSG